MTKRIFKGITIAVFTATALAIGALLIMPKDFFRPRRNRTQTRIIIPQSTDGNYESRNSAERLAYEDSMTAKITLDEGEAVVTVLTQDFNNDNYDEQIIAYRNLLEIDNPIYITYVDFDRSANSYRRIWSTATAATRPGTVNLYTEDLIGDRSVCLLISGMNNAGEHTLTIFRKNPPARQDQDAFNKIAEIRIDGSISVQEQERSQAYQMGQTRGQSFSIAAYGRDYESANILDQIEITYSYNPVSGLYEQSRITRVPGTHIEQRRVRELLNGDPGEFEKFVDGIWYFVGSEGTMDTEQYIYFDTWNRELIFYSDDTQQVFSWKNSSPTRYGLYLSSQNISLANLRRFLNIELESLDSIRIRVFEDIHLRIGVSAPWDGSYRRVVETRPEPVNQGSMARFSAVYDSSIGKMSFFEDGTYELNGAGGVQRGRYSFFNLDSRELLELRRSGENGIRETYLVEVSNPKTPIENRTIYGNLVLSRIKIGTKGIENMHEAVISLALVEDTKSGS
jgi:hypothetical protein